MRDDKAILAALEELLDDVLAREERIAEVRKRVEGQQHRAEGQRRALENRISELKLALEKRAERLQVVPGG